MSMCIDVVLPCLNEADALPTVINDLPPGFKPSGTVLLETSRYGAGLWRGTARLRDHSGTAGSWFPWAVVGAEVLPGWPRPRDCA